MDRVAVSLSPIRYHCYHGIECSNIYEKRGVKK
jgi:hypothetical protein